MSNSNSGDHSPVPPKVSAKNNGIIILAIIASFTAFFFASVVLFQLIFSFYLFFLLNPLVEWGIKKGISRKVGSVVVVLGMIAITVGITWGSFGAVSNLAEEIPQYTSKIKKTIKLLQGQADEIQKNTNGILPATPQKDDVQKVEVMEGIGGGKGEVMLHGVGSVFEALAATFLVPILLLFLLLEKPYLKAALFDALPEKIRKDQVNSELTKMIRGFFFGNVVVGLGTAIGFYILFTVLHLENRLLLALVSGFINLIPMVGAILACVLPMLQAYLQFDNFTPALSILISSVFLHFFVANFIIPKIVGSRINVNATAATIGLIFWGWLWGPVGLLLAVPLTATIRTFLAAQSSTERWAKLIAEDHKGEMTRMTFKKSSNRTG